MIERGKTYTAYKQGTNITPHTREATVVHISDLDVYYRLDGKLQVYSTPIERFREIVRDAD